MKRIHYLVAILALCVIALFATCTANAQTPADVEQDRRLVKDQARQDKANTKVTTALAERLAEKTSATTLRQNEASVSANTAQDVANLAANSAQDDAAVIVAMVQDDRVSTIEEQSVTDRQFMMLLSAAVGLMLISVWWMQYRATSRLEGASKDTWKGVELILLRTELLQAFLEKEAPEVVEKFAAVLKEVEGKND